MKVPDLKFDIVETVDNITGPPGSSDHIPHFQLDNQQGLGLKVLHTPEFTLVKWPSSTLTH